MHIGGDTIHFFLLTLYNFKNNGGGARFPLPPLPPTPRSLNIIQLNTTQHRLKQKIPCNFFKLPRVLAACRLNGDYRQDSKENKKHQDSNSEPNLVPSDEVHNGESD